MLLPRCHPANQNLKYACRNQPYTLVPVGHQILRRDTRYLHVSHNTLASALSLHVASSEQQECKTRETSWPSWRGSVWSDSRVVHSTKISQPSCAARRSGIQVSDFPCDRGYPQAPTPKALVAQISIKHPCANVPPTWLDAGPCQNLRD